MGTTLTGTTPQDTYDSLIKVTDNGPLSGSLKTLTDGLGNDSALALSTGAASVAGTLGVTGALTIGNAGVVNGIINSADGMYLNIDSDASGSTPEFQFAKGRSTASGGTVLMSITNAGNVGIGTSAPSEPLVVSSPLRDYTSAQFSTLLQSTTPQSVGRGGSLGLAGETGGSIIAFGGIIGAKENSVFAETGGYLAFTTRANGGPLTEKVRILSSGGITFNGDTAAANALDDYEEGTFTATLKGSTTDPTTPVTTTANYTKIGRQATVNIRFSDVDLTGCTGDLYIAGLPFTAASGMGSFTGTLSTHTVDFNGGTTAELHVSSGGTVAYLFSSLTNAAWRAMDSSSSGVYIQGTITYFV